MPVNHKFELIFVHIPKTGGSTIERLVKSQSQQGWDLWGDIHSDQRIFERFPNSKKICRLYPDRIDQLCRQDLYHHLILADIQKLMPADQFHRYRKFTVIRNPWDRLVSCYEYSKQTGGRLGTADKSFTDWFYERPATVQMLPYLELENEDFNNSLTLLRFERFNDDLEAFFANVGLKWDSRVHEKKTQRWDYHEYYNDQMAAMLYDECRADIEAFGYDY